MAFTQIVTPVNNGSYNALTGDGHSYYDTGLQAGLQNFNEINIYFQPVFSGAGAPFAVVYGADANNILYAITTLDIMKQHIVLGISGQADFADKLQLKVFQGVSTLPVQFSLSVTGKP
jgi:hypothetical protein